MKREFLLLKYRKTTSPGTNELVMVAWSQEEKVSTHIWCLKLKTSDL